jgi:hypothetical protein
LKDKIFSGLLTKIYSLEDVAVSEENKEKISEIYSEINSVIQTAKQAYQNLYSTSNVAKRLLRDIYNERIPNIKSKIYNSMIETWKLILKKALSKTLINRGIDLRNKSIFKLGISVLGFGFKIYGNIDKLISKIKVNITFNPNDLSVSVNLQVQNALQFSIGGSVDVLLVGGGVKATVSFGDFDFQLKPTVNFYSLQNIVPLYIYYKVPQLCFKADVYYTVPIVKCKVIWIFPVCYPWVETRHKDLVNKCTSSKTFTKNRTYYYDIFDRNKINRKSITNQNLMISITNWIMNNF